MNDVIKKKEFIKDGFFDKLFKRENPYNAIIEINNLLCSVEINKITQENIINIGHNYKIKNILNKYRKDFFDIYKLFLNNFISDKKFSDEELSILKHLKLLFGLNDKEVNDIQTQMTTEIYKNEVKNVFADDKLTNNEKEFLSNLQKDLKLPNSIADKLYNESATKLLQDYVNRITSDQRISPEEENELNELTKNLNVDLNLDNNSKSAFQKMKLFWKIENGDIPVIEANINLQKKEVCYFVTNVKWYEMRTVTKRINYGGPTLSIKIAKGLYWRTGSMNVQNVSQDIMKLIDIGTLYLTNKRLIFMGQKNNKTINLNKILDFTCYKNGFDIQKDTGKSPFIEFSENVDLFAIIFGQCIKQEL